MKVLLPFVLVIITSLVSAQDQSKLLYKIEGKEIAYPRLSKDGKKILYQSNANGPWTLHIMDIATGTHKVVLQDKYNNNFPDWSYDNEWIAFVSDRDGNEEVYMMKTDGSHLTRITKDPERDIHPYFSPDGKSILINSTRGNGSLDIYEYIIASGELKRITSTPEEETCARYSPDMKYMVYLQNDHSKDDVILTNLSTKTSVNLSRTPQFRDGWPMFSYDSQWVYYSSMETGIYCIYKIKIDGSGKTKLTNAAAGEEDARISVSREGDFFIYNKRYGHTIELRQIST